MNWTSPNFERPDLPDPDRIVSSPCTLGGGDVVDGQQTHASDLAALEDLADRFGFPTGTGAAADRSSASPTRSRRHWHDEARSFLLAASLALRASPRRRKPGGAPAGPPPVGHVFVVVLENENADSTFAPDSPAPYLSQTLPSQGAFIPEYYGVTHLSLGNYIALVSGQGSNPRRSPTARSSPTSSAA